MLDLRPACESCNKALPRIPSKRAFARMSARSAQTASVTCSATFAPAAAADSFRDLSDLRETGRAIISSAKILRVLLSSTDRLIQQLMRNFRRRSRTFRRKSDSGVMHEMANPMLLPA
jgi:hypothetical protein